MFHVLVVDDFAPWRAYLRQIVQQCPDCLGIDEASDGREAIRKVARHQPDVILFDIGLPELNGIAAARVIKAAFPHIAIIFVSQETAADIVDAALTVGQAYVPKMCASTQLRDTLNIVLQRRAARPAGLAA